MKVTKDNTKDVLNECLTVLKLTPNEGEQERFMLHCKVLAPIVERKELLECYLGVTRAITKQPGYTQKSYDAQRELEMADGTLLLKLRLDHVFTHNELVKKNITTKLDETFIIDTSRIDEFELVKPKEREFVTHLLNNGC